MSTKAQITEPRLVSRAIHELSSGDCRILNFERSLSGITNLHSVQFGTNSSSNEETHPTITSIHIPERHYLYGTSYAPDGQDTHIYDDFQTQGCSDYTLLHTQNLPGGHVSWSAIDGAEMVRRHKAYGSDTVVSTGLTGVYHVAGIDPTVNYLWVSIERQESVVAVVRGPHVLFHQMIPVGTSNFIQSLCDVFRSEAPFARMVLEKHGFLHTHHDSRVRDVLLHAASPIVVAIEQVMSAMAEMPYRKSFEREPITAWLFGGVGSSIPGLSEYLSLFINAGQWQGISDEYRQVIQSSKTPISRESLPRYYMVLGLTVAD